MKREKQAKRSLRDKVLNAVRIIDGFCADEVAQLCCCTLAEAEEALNDLKRSGHLITEYVAMRGYVWRIVR